MIPECAISISFHIPLFLGSSLLPSPALSSHYFPLHPQCPKSNCRRLSGWVQGEHIPFFISSALPHFPTARYRFLFLSAGTSGPQCLIIPSPFFQGFLGWDDQETDWEPFPFSPLPRALSSYHVTSCTNLLFMAWFGALPLSIFSSLLWKYRNMWLFSFLLGWRESK